MVIKGDIGNYSFWSVWTMIHNKLRIIFILVCYTAIVNRFGFLIGLVITIGLLMAVPYFYTQNTKAYSCNSSGSSSVIGSGTTSSRVTGSSGSCSSSSSSTSRFTESNAMTKFPPFPPNVQLNTGAGASSSSSGGAQ